MTKINLHMHTKCSLDGEYDINELIDKFKEENYNVIAITDHDTCEAYYQIKDYDDIKIITGIEADAIVENCTYDFLCYGFDLDNVYKYASLKYKTVDERQKIIFNELVRLCNEKSIKLTDIDTYNPLEEYAHSAIYRMLDKSFLDENNIRSMGDFYRMSTIDKKFPLYIDMHIVWPDIKELLDIIHVNKGKVFLAHPYRYNKPVIDVLNTVKDYVDGIEICNNPNNSEEVEFLYRYAKENNLLVSCGSDYHGNDRYSMNCSYVTEEMLKDILSWIE